MVWWKSVGVVILRGARIITLQDPLCAVESRSLLCRIGVKSPKHVTGSCSMTWTAATKTWAMFNFRSWTSHMKIWKTLSFHRSIKFSVNAAWLCYLWHADPPRFSSLTFLTANSVTLSHSNPIQFAYSRSDIANKPYSTCRILLPKVKMFDSMTPLCCIRAKHDSP